MDPWAPALQPVKSVPVGSLSHKHSCPNLGRCSSGETDADSRSSSPRAHGHTSALSQLLRELRQSRGSIVGKHARTDEAPDTPSFLADVAYLQAEHHGNNWFSPEPSPRHPSLGADHTFFAEETHNWRYVHSNSSGTSSSSESSSPLRRVQGASEVAEGCCGRRLRRHHITAARRHAVMMDVSRSAPSCSSHGISRAKAVLAEAIRCTHTGRCLVDAPSIKDTGVLSPLLAMIRASSNGGSGSGDTPSSHQASSNGAVRGHAGNSTSSSNGHWAAARFATPFAAAAHAPLPLAAAQPSAAPTPPPECKVLDCLNTVRLLAIDEASRQALLELGAVPLMLSKLRPGAASPAVVAGALRALAALVRSDSDKRRVWQDERGGPLLLSLLRGQRGATVTTAAFNAVVELGWEAGKKPRVLLEPQLVGALSALLHPSADCSVLLPALELLMNAAASANAATLPGWQHCIFRLAPLLVVTGRPGSGGVVAGALSLLLELAELPGLRSTVCAAGCLPPLLALLFDVDAALGSSAACLLTTLVHTRMGQERLSEEAALIMLLRVLQEQETAADIKLGALYVLRCLAQERPGVAHRLKLHSAIRTLARLQQQEGEDEDVRHGVNSLLKALGPATQQGSSMRLRRAALAAGPERSSASCSLVQQQLPLRHVSGEGCGDAPERSAASCSMAGGLGGDSSTGATCSSGVAGCSVGSGSAAAEPTQQQCNREGEAVAAAAAAMGLPFQLVPPGTCNKGSPLAGVVPPAACG